MGWRRYARKAVEDAEKNAEAGDLPELSEGMTLELSLIHICTNAGKTDNTDSIEIDPDMQVLPDGYEVSTDARCV